MFQAFANQLLILFHFGFVFHTWWRGRPTMEGKTARGASSPAKPALHMPEPLSTTRAAASSSHILMKLEFSKIWLRKDKEKVRTVSTQIDDCSEWLQCPAGHYILPPSPSPFLSLLPHLLGCLGELLLCPYTESTFPRLLVTSGPACLGQYNHARSSKFCFTFFFSVSQLSFCLLSFFLSPTYSQFYPSHFLSPLIFSSLGYSCFFCYS